MEKQYWAAADTETLAQDIIARIDEYYSEVDSSKYFDVLRKSYRAYYGSSGKDYSGQFMQSAYVQDGGVQGEEKLVKINNYRNLIQHVLTLATNPRPAWQARSTNTDYKSQTQTILADGILEYYMREKRVERYIKQAGEYALLFGAGYISMEWDTSLGEQYVSDEEGKLVNTGDIRFRVYSPLDVPQDLYKDNDDEHIWRATRNYENKYDLAAKYPELEEEIVALEARGESDKYTFHVKKSQFKTDDICVYTFYHEKTDALPEGRMVKLLDKDVVLYDGPLPYRKIPLTSVTSGKFYGSSFHYSPFFDLLGMQDTLDRLYSSVVTNNITFGIQNIYSPRGSNVSVTQIDGGLNLLEGDATVGPPQALQLTASSPETYNLIDKLENTMETLAGINSVIRGNPEASLKSGSALALVASQALQFNSAFQGSIVEGTEDVGTGIVHLLQDYATVPRIAAIVGKYNRPYTKEFKGEDISEISRVTVDVGSPLQRTSAGRVELADKLLEKGMVKNPDEYLMVIQTGKLEPMTEADTSEMLLIKAENEKLRNGEQIMAVATEKHNVHIQEHKAVLANPETKENPEIVQATLDHINEHLDLLRNTDPGLLMVLGMEPMPPNPQQQPPQMQGAPGPEAGPTGAGELMELQPPVGAQADMPQMPSMPENPLTGQEYNLETGGL